MKFRVKKDFVYKGKIYKKNDVVEILFSEIEKLRAKDVLGEPIKEFNIEKAVIKSKEKQITK